jgi:hypothetical protein
MYFLLVDFYKLDKVVPLTNNIGGLGRYGHHSNSFRHKAILL